MTAWLMAAKASEIRKQRGDDPNAQVEFVAEFLWRSYVARVSGPQLVEAAGLSWEEQDDQTWRIYLNHARAAINAVSAWNAD